MVVVDITLTSNRVTMAVVKTTILSTAEQQVAKAALANMAKDTITSMDRVDITKAMVFSPLLPSKMPVWC